MVTDCAHKIPGPAIYLIELDQILHFNVLL